MGAFTIGEVVLVRFPFSDLSAQKLRPALVLGHSDFDNVVVCQITSRLPDSATAITLTDMDFAIGGGLAKTSYIRTNKIFTSDPSIIVKSIGMLNSNLKKQTYAQLIKTFAELEK